MVNLRCTSKEEKLCVWSFNYFNTASGASDLQYAEVNTFEVNRTLAASAFKLNLTRWQSQIWQL